MTLFYDALMVLVIAVLAICILAFLMIRRPEYRNRTVNTWLGLLLIVGGISATYLIMESDEHAAVRRYRNWNDSWKTVSSTKRSIKNTAWVYADTIAVTDSLNNWCKIEFKNKKLYHYEMKPSGTSWGKPVECDYEVSQHKYPFSEETYIRISWSTGYGRYAFVPIEHSLYKADQDNKFTFYGNVTSTKD